MYSLVIADDEQNICNGISSAVKNACPEIEIVGTFFDGNDLLEFLKTSHTDILICDIRMEGISGVDIAKYIYEHKKETHVILITGYRMFEYAQKAINYKVDFFLTKPFSSVTLIEKIKQIEQFLKNDLQNAINSKKSLMSDWNNSRKNVQKLFFGEWDSDISPIADISFFLEENCTVYEICYVMNEPETDVSQKIIESCAESAIDLGEFSSNKTLCFYCGFSDNELYFALFTNDGIDISLIDSFISGMRTVCNKSFNSKYQKFDSAYTYGLFCKSRKFFNDCISFVPSVQNLSWANYIDSKLSKCSRQELSALYKYISDSFTNDEIQFNAENDDLISSLKSFFTVIRESNSELKNSSDILVEKAYECVFDHYSDYNISVYNIASMLCVNSDYLSRIFKKKTGQGLATFLLKTRMKKAAELLEGTSMSVAEIAAAVGYNDISYFKRTFKSYNGVSPTDYRKTSDSGTHYSKEEVYD